MSVIIRSMTAADLEVAGRLAGGLVRQHRAFDPSRFMDIPDVEVGYARYFAQQLDETDTVLVVAEAAGRVVGYAFARLEPKSYESLREACGWLHDVFVDPEARSGGVGEALLREVLLRLEAKGAPQVLLLTAVQNESAQRLFARLGFRTTMLEMTRARGVS